jgi:hypothetical protein
VGNHRKDVLEFGKRHVINELDERVLIQLKKPGLSAENWTMPMGEEPSFQAA